MKIGLVLEGGGMRGIYTAAVLDYFLEKKLSFDNITAVSAGVSNALSYVAQQKERNRNIYLKYANDKRYLSFYNFIRTKSFFGWDFIYDTLSNSLEPFDYQTFYQNKVDIHIVISNIEKEEAEYHKLINIDESKKYIIASSSLPLISKIVDINDQKYLDGGIYDAIPYKYSFDLGNDKVVLVLTRDISYEKKKAKNILSRIVYKKYPLFIKKLNNRYLEYNQTLNEIKQLEKDNKVFVIRPSKVVNFKRFERNIDHLKWLYDLGNNDAKEMYSELIKFIQKKETVNS